ncbi:MAG: small multi-drug export protein, partial [Sulfurimonadaceae bacterium]|nr:small multi-drug export protein [Sulfurimonadaceae bacterium]
VVQTSEGKLLLGAITGWLLFGVTILVTGYVDEKSGLLLSGITAAHIVFGRAAGISVGFAMDAGLWTVVLLNMLIEALLVLLAYPIFVLGWKKLYTFEWFDNWMHKAHANARKYRPVIAQYGVYGLFAFVWFPFWMTGPVVGSMIGFLMGLSHRMTLLVVLGSTFLAVFCWALLLMGVQEWATDIDPRAPWIIVGIIISAAVLMTLRRNNRQH